MPWRVVERKIGRAGGLRQRTARQRDWDRRYGEDNWEVGYLIDGEFVTRAEALEWADVTVFDNSPVQLAQDRLVADREGLEIETVLGDMADLGVFPEARFDLIVHPVSNVFAPDVRPVWREAFRVLRPGGSLLAGFMNPVQYLFDDIGLERGELRVAHRIPYSDIAGLTDEDRARLVEEGRPLEFGHTLGDQIGGQTAAGLVLTGFYEDIDPESVLGEHIPSYIATRALRPGS
jgi:SAM-dependent methyltransferase